MPRPLSENDIADFRATLCDVATQLFAKHGFAGVTMRALATEAGCSAMTPYGYFANKEEIFNAVRMQAFGRFGAKVHSAVARVADPAMRLRTLCHEYVGFALEEPHSYRIMFQLDAPEFPSNAEERALVEETWQPLLATLAELVDTGVLAGESTELAHHCWFMVHGAVSLHLAGKLIFGCVLEDSVDPMIDLLLQGAAVGSRQRGQRR